MVRGASVSSSCQTKEVWNRCARICGAGCGDHLRKDGVTVVRANRVVCLFCMPCAANRGFDRHAGRRRLFAAFVAWPSSFVGPRLRLVIQAMLSSRNVARSWAAVAVAAAICMCSEAALANIPIDGSPTDLLLATRFRATVRVIAEQADRVRRESQLLTLVAMPVPATPYKLANLYPVQGLPSVAA